MPRTTPVAQKIIDGYTRQVRLGKGRYVRQPLYRLLRGLAGRMGDPLVSLRVGDHRMMLPISHQLPLIRAAVPEYGENLVVIAEETHRKYPDLRAIDVGANVGDTAMLMSSKASFPILCVEGDNQFLPLLHRNLANLPDATVVEAYVGFAEGTEGLAASRTGGTARLLPTGSAGGVALRPLDEIVAKEPAFAAAKLLKIDTDGFDGRIIHSAAGFLARSKPVVFFEYSPYWSERTGDPDLRSALDVLVGAGYLSLLVYKNTGVLLDYVPVGDKAAFDSIESSLGTPAPDRYFDICAFHSEDEDLRLSIQGRHE